MKARSTSRNRPLARVEPLEPRLALAVNVLSPLADITRPSTATTETISVAGRFDDPAVTGTVVRFDTNGAAPADRLFVELFDQAGPGRTRTTPLTVTNFLSYVDDGSYTNTIIHRSVTDFVVQGGGFKAPTAALGQPGGTPTTIPAKSPVNNEPGNTNARGTIAMAKFGGDPNSATNQWFFNLANNNDPTNPNSLDNQNGGFTAFGRVLGGGMAAVDAMAAVPTYDASGLYGNAFDDVPLRDIPNPIPNPLIVQPGQFVTLPSISRVGELVYSVTSSDPTLVAASFLSGSGGTNLQLEHKPDRSGTAVITVRAASVFDPTNFVEDSFSVVRELPPPTAPGAPGVASGVPVNGRVNLSWTAPASNGGAAITDYVVQFSSNNGTNWTTFNDGTSVATSTVVTGLTNGTNYVFRVASVNSAGAGVFSAASAVVTPRSVFAVGAEIGVGSAPIVRLVNASTGVVLAEKTVFEAGFRGGVRVAMGDLDGDGVPEVVASSGPGRVGDIRAFRQQVSGGVTTLQELPAYSTLPFGPRYTGGVEVAVGDVDGDGREDLVAAMSRGAGTVNVFRSVNAADPIENTAYRTFTPFGATFDGGASIAVADVGTFVAGARVSATAPDGKVEIVVGSGAGMRSTVRVYDISATPRVVTTLLPFPASQQGGVTVSAGRYDADSIDDIVVSSGRGGRSAVRVFNGRTDQAASAVLASSSAFAAFGRPNAPVFTAPIDLDGDGKIDRFHATQGDAGASAGVLKVAINGTSSGQLGTLKGPLRIAAPRRG
jgi:cyclophilin family peptidyl-prolyl cis-trans isomerase